MYHEFAQPAPIIFGRGSISILADKIRELKCKKVMLVFEKGIEDAGIAEKAVECLENGGIDYVTFNGVLPDPTDKVVDKAGETAVKNGVDCIVGLGGGSSLDTAKAASILVTNPGPARKYIHPAPIFVNTTTPVILIPTTAGTGSECTRVSIISIPEENAKWSVFVNTTLGIVDPDLTLTLPRSETANTGLDALSHAAEALTSKYNNRHSDLYAEAAIKKIAENLITCYNEPSNTESRSEMALAANWAGLAFNNPLTHVGHSVADAFSCHFHTPHGLGCALALPETMKLTSQAEPERMQTIARALGITLTGGETGTQIGQMVADNIRGMMRAMNMKSPEELGYTREQVLALAPDVVSNHLSSYCPVEINEDTARELLAAIYDTYR